ncbi:MAG TPA: serine/threonine-protein kinase, partial [Vicinamibacterales bacterium]|nr:serine/threonine-protein kinase [Vicinamibacterales bacterium]
MIGKTLGPYKVVAKLGEGGMGEVYRARDTRLNRDVAIKTLPEMFAQDPERLARFEREAQVLASLNHPHIAALYGIEDSGAVRGLVMELVEGQTLADVIGAASRQARPSHGLPLEEALRIARQIAEALAAAHEHGLVHRDLKPANVKLRPDGAVKVLDFGLAKPLGSDNPAGDLSNSPTLPAGDTRAGMILGTAAYMSPEQARGRPVDRRTDVWAFGCVLYEMLTGRRAFEGDEVTDVLARIIEREPDMNALPPSTPVAIRRLLRRCLEKDRGRRLADLGSACIEIDDALAGPDANEGPATTPRAPAGPWLRVIPVTLAVAAIGFTAGWMLRRDPLLTAPRAMRFTIIPPPSAPLFADSIGSELAIAPDGRHVVYVGIPGSTPQLYVRSFDRLESRALVGTAGARQPFFAPDGESVGFWAPGDGELRKVSLSGGPVVTICRAPSGNFYGASW